MVEISVRCKLRLNLSYFLTQSEMKNDQLESSYREWIIFDSFLFNDVWPIHHFNLGNTGNTIEINFHNSEDFILDNYFQHDYDNLNLHLIYGYQYSNQLFQDSAPVSYKNLYQHYLVLPEKKRDMIEWYVSKPPILRQGLNPIFRNDLWDILRSCILLENIIGLPPHCTEYHRCSTCGQDNIMHNSEGSKKYRKNFFTNTIADDVIREQYLTLVEEAFSIRHQMVHRLLINKAQIPEIPKHPEVKIYDIVSSVRTKNEDSHALFALSRKIEDVCRALLLNDIFGFSIFLPPADLHTTLFGEGIN